MLFAQDLSAPEAPVLLPDGSWLVTEMGLQKGCVTWISKDGSQRRTVIRTGRPNGLAVDSQGVVWIAETLHRPALLTATLEGECHLLVDRCGDQPFLFPNDLAIGPDGALYMTDSGVRFEDLVIGDKITPDVSALAINGSVYRIDTTTKAVSVLDRGLRFANGIAFGPDGRLYVTESLTGAIHRYRLAGGAIAGAREQFANVIDPDRPIGSGGPDGIAFGCDGRLYVAVYGQGHVAVLATDGTIERRIPTRGLNPTNASFGSRGEKTLFVTEDESGTFDRLSVDTDGLPLHTHIGAASAGI